MESRVQPAEGMQARIHAMTAFSGASWKDASTDAHSVQGRTGPGGSRVISVRVPGLRIP